ncbi:MAG: FAD-binding protein, partial [Holdemania filiformis]
MRNSLERLRCYGDVTENVPMSTLTTLRIGGNARAVVYPKTMLALTQVLRLLAKQGIPYKIFGKGSNLLCSDNDYEGVILKLDRYHGDFYFDGQTVVAEAGCSIIALSYEAMKHSLSGLEFASGIPG